MAYLMNTLNSITLILSRRNELFFPFNYTKILGMNFKALENMKFSILLASLAFVKSMKVPSYKTKKKSEREIIKSLCYIQETISL
jgi:hypothetical protein